MYTVCLFTKPVLDFWPNTNLSLSLTSADTVFVISRWLCLHDNRTWWTDTFNNTHTPDIDLYAIIAGLYSYSVVQVSVTSQSWVLNQNYNEKKNLWHLITDLMTLLCQQTHTHTYREPYPTLDKGHNTLLGTKVSEGVFVCVLSVSAKTNPSQPDLPSLRLLW